MEISTGWSFSLIGPIIQIFNIVLLVAVVILATRILRRLKVLDFMKKLWLELSLWLRITTIISTVFTVIWFVMQESNFEFDQVVFSRFLEIYGSITFGLLTVVIIALLVESSEKRRTKKQTDDS